MPRRTKSTPPPASDPPVESTRSLYHYLRLFLIAVKEGHIQVEDRDDSQRKIVTLVPREAQLRLHAAMMKQAAAGRPVRIVVTKSRKFGISSWVQALYDFLCENSPNFRALTLAHTRPDTQAIFRIAKTVYENMPGVRDAEITADAIKWPHGSEYVCRTAGSKGVARGDTFHAMHFSEMAFYDEKGGPEELEFRIQAAMNAVPNREGTIVIIESTGSGPSGPFYERAQQAYRGKGAFELCFFPWYLDEGATADYLQVGDNGDAALTDEERRIQQEYALTDAQIAFYHNKCLEASSRGEGFLVKREYPTTFADCFAAAAGRVYPGYGEIHRRNLAAEGLDVLGGRFKLYRAIDWGFGPDPFVCLWIAHDSSAQPGLIVSSDVSCDELHREMLSYQWDEKRDFPKDKENHGPDCLRYGITSLDGGLTGLVVVYRALYVNNASLTRPDGCARLIHQMTGWTVPGSGDLTKAMPGPQAEFIQHTIADRSQPGLISQFVNWNIPCSGQIKPKLATSRGEVRDGISMVQTLIGGTTRFYRERTNAHLTTLESALDKMQHSTMRRQRLLTPEEREALAREVSRRGAETPHRNPLSLTNLGFGSR